MSRRMKDSGIEWIGEIPEDWDVSKFKRYSKSFMGNTILKNDLLDEKNSNSIPVYSATKEDKIFGYVDKSIVTSILNKNDLVIPARGNSIGSTKIVPYKKATCTQTTIYSKLHDIDPQFTYLCSVALKDYWFEFDQTAIPQITVQQVENNYIPICSIDEQNMISKFLINKLDKLERVNNTINQEIKNLEDYKKSIITEAVTKGLDKNVEMKDSGIEWIGEIPEQWDIIRLKLALIEKMKYGANEQGVEYSEDLPRYIRITDIDKNNKLKNEGKQSLTEKQSNGFILRDKTVLFARSGATVGKTFLYRKEYGKSAFAGYLISANTNPDIMKEKWLYYFTMTNSYDQWIGNVFSQSTIQNVSAEKYSNLQIPITNIQGQMRIINYLDKKCQLIDDYISIKKQQLEKLEEYKKSLIYEYVTGKKEVKDV